MEPYIGQIQAFGFNFAPRGWAKCEGQLLPISANAALFSLLGTTYGGDGISTFALPDFRGRSMIHQGAGPGLPSYSIGQRGGHNSANITTQNMPSHAHTLTNGVAKISVTTTAGSGTNESDNGANGLNTGGLDMYVESPAGSDKLGGVAISGQTDANGGSQPFDITNPFLVVNVCIALVGIFPPRD